MIGALQFLPDAYGRAADGVALGVHQEQVGHLLGGEAEGALLVAGQTRHANAGEQRQDHDNDRHFQQRESTSGAGWASLS